MHECPHCGTPLTARPSHCYERGNPLSVTTQGRRFPGLLLIALAGVALATIAFLGTAL